jgi:putative addiction module component (TIGR02574 family)
MPVAEELVRLGKMQMSTLQEIIDAARLLSPADRPRLVDAVWDDDHPDNWPALTPEWLAEIRQRSAEFDAGRMTASPWEDVQTRVRRKAGLDD